MKDRYLNEKYKDLETEKRTDFGTTVKLNVDVSPTKPSAPPKPPLKWIVTRSSLDDAYADDPVLAEKVVQTTSFGRSIDRHILTMTIPDVTLARYGVVVKLGTRVVKTFDEFVTWRRVYFDVEADTKYAYEIYERSLAKVIAWFKRVNVLVVPNTLEVAGAVKASKDKSENEVLGTRILLQLKEAKWDAQNVTFDLQFTNGAPPATSRSTTLSGTSLRIELDSQCSWNPKEDLLAGVTVEQGTNTLLSLRYFNRDAGDPAKLARMVTRTSDRVITIDLNDAALAPLLNLVTTRADFKLTLNLKFDQFGRELGGQVGTQKRVSYYFYPAAECARFNHTQTEKSVAQLIAHEVGHVMKLGRRDQVTNYAVVQRSFELDSGGAQVARAKNPVTATNALFHLGDQGGQGLHCSFGCRLVASATTSSGHIYEPDPTLKTCVMYHSGGGDHTRDTGFCDTCSEFLRRGW